MRGGRRLGGYPSSWSFSRMTPNPSPDEELLTRLAERPELLEPGLVIFPEAPEMGDGPEVPLHGVDPAGCPVLVLPHRLGEQSLSVRVMELAASLKNDPDAFRLWYPSPECPRFFLVASDWTLGELERLAILGEAVSLKAFSIRRDGPGGFRLRREIQTGGEEDPAGILEEGRATLLRRLLRSSTCIQPPLSLPETSWPLILMGRHGPSASIHHMGGNLVFAIAGREGPCLVELADEDAVDEALDLLLRGQWAGAA